MTKKLFFAFSLLTLIALTACQDFDYGYKSYEPQTADTYYTRRFANRGDVNVCITTETPGAPYFVYFENPYDAEGNFTGATAYLQGLTPLETKLSVPHHVDSLYVVSPMREMRVIKAGDVQIADKNLVKEGVKTRVDITEYPYELPEGFSGTYYYLPQDGAVKSDNGDITDEVVNYVNASLPDGQTNINLADQHKNTDLTFTQEQGDYVAVWISYLGQGKNDPEGKVWFYIYDGSIENPTIEQVSGYAIGNNTVVPYKLNLNSNGYNGAKPTLYTSDKDTKIGETVFIGYIKAGYNIGFAYMEYYKGGGNRRMRFTTPSLNAAARGNMNDPISDGTIVHQSFVVDGESHAFNFVGFENHDENSDNDYNDFLLCIETNPEIRPKEEVIITPPSKERHEYKGYYLFEDLYEPGEKVMNDNDFNDVVLYYEKSVYNAGTDPDPIWYADFSLELLAHACANTNEVGIYHNASEIDARKYTMFTGINGEKNMEDPAPVFTHAGREKITTRLQGKDDVLLPYLRTTVMDGEPTTYDPTDPNQGNIYTTTYATKDFPYAMEIPFVAGKPFRWMKEGVIITEGYKWTKTADGTDNTPWYVTPKDASKLVPRAQGSTY